VRSVSLRGKRRFSDADVERVRLLHQHALHQPHDRRTRDLYFYVRDIGLRRTPMEKECEIGFLRGFGHLRILNVTVTSAISALRKHERPWEIGDIIEVLEAWEVAQVARVRRSI
jgi:hypothetical protein